MGRLGDLYSLSRRRPTSGTTPGALILAGLRRQQTDTTWSPGLLGLGLLCHPSLAVPGKPPPAWAKRGARLGRDGHPTATPLCSRRRRLGTRGGNGRPFTARCPFRPQYWTRSTKLCPGAHRKPSLEDGKHDICSNDPEEVPDLFEVQVLFFTGKIPIRQIG